MAKYINQERLIGRLHKAEENYRAHHDYDTDDDPYSDGILSAMFSVNQIVVTEHIADVVEREKIKQALDEAHRIRITVLGNNGRYESDEVLGLVEEIIQLFEEI